MEVASIWKKLDPDQRYRLALIAILAIALWPLFLGRYYAVGDMRDVYIPLELFFQQELGLGHLPAWNDNAAWGFPVIASGQIGFYYPPLLLGRLALPIGLYLSLILAGHLAAGALGMYQFGKKIGMIRGGAFICAVAFALSAYWWQHLSHLNIFLAIAWLPWQLKHAYETGIKQYVGAKDLALISLLLGLPFLIGQLQIPLLMAAVSGIYFLWIRWRLYQQTAAPVFFMMAVALIVILISTAQTVPTWQLVKFSSRGQTSDFDLKRANQHSYPVYHLPTYLFPRFYNTDDKYWGRRLEIEYGSFVGTAPLILSLWIWLKRKKILAANNIQRLNVSFFGYAAFVSFVLALGSYSPFRLIGIEPSLWFFSAPARWLLFTTMGLSVLAGYGYSNLSTRPVESAKILRYAAVLVLLVVLAGNLPLFAVTADSAAKAVAWTQARIQEGAQLSNEVYNREKIQNLLVSARASSISVSSAYTWLPIASLFLAAYFARRPGGQQALLAITAVEMIIVAGTTVPAVSWQDILSPPASINLLPESIKNRSARIYSIREGGDTGALFTNPESRADQNERALQRELLVPMISSQFGIPDVQWPASLDITEQTRALNKLRHEEGYAIKEYDLARELNIGAILTPSGLADIPWPEFAATSGISIYQSPFLPRYEFIDSGGTHHALNWNQLSPSHLVFETDSADAGRIIARDTWFPGWRARIDDDEAQVEKYGAFFRQISVPAGRHQVNMFYDASLLIYSALVSVAAVGACCIMYIYSRKRI